MLNQYNIFAFFLGSPFCPAFLYSIQYTFLTQHRYYCLVLVKYLIWLLFRKGAQLWLAACQRLLVKLQISNISTAKRFANLVRRISARLFELLQTNLVSLICVDSSTQIIYNIRLLFYTYFNNKIKRLTRELSPPTFFRLGHLSIVVQVVPWIWFKHI